MARKSKKQAPTNPQDIAARRAERRDMEARGLEVNVDPRTQEILGAWRPDCFQMLLRRHVEELAAVLWLEELIRTASGENGNERRPDFIRASCEGAPGQNVSQRMIEASRVLEVVEGNLRPWEARLLFDLLKPDQALLTRWRDSVQRVTGETHSHSQGAVVRMACTNLLWVRSNLAALTKMHRDRKEAA